MCGLSRPGRWEQDIFPHIFTRKPNVLIEQPTIYPHSKANPTHVMALQLKVGELKGRFEMIGCVVELVEPRTWKGQVPKEIHGRRTMSVLTPAEAALAAGKRHDVLDAIGLGLWKLGRMK